jgi:hypothetical protein
MLTGTGPTMPSERKIDPFPDYIGQNECSRSAIERRPRPIPFSASNGEAVPNSTIGREKPQQSMVVLDEGCHPPSFGRSNRTARDGIPLGLHRTHGEGRGRRGGLPKREAIHRGPHETPSGDAGFWNSDQILDGSGSSGNRFRYSRVPVTFQDSRIDWFFMKVSDARPRSRVGLPGNHSRGEPG